LFSHTNSISKVDRLVGGDDATHTQPQCLIAAMHAEQSSDRLGVCMTATSLALAALLLRRCEPGDTLFLADAVYVRLKAFRRRAVL
jgi:hypothetical protein